MASNVEKQKIENQPEEEMVVAPKNQPETEKLPLEERVKTILELQDEALDREEKKQKPGILARARKLATVAIVLGTSLLAVGCKSGAKGGGHPSEGPVEQQKTMQTDQQGIEQIQKESGSFMNALKSFAWADDGKKANPGYIIDVGGGDYRDLDSDGVDALSKITLRWQERIDKAHEAPRNSAAALSESVLINDEHTVVSEKIKEMGSKVDAGALPEKLLRHEEERQNAVDDMAK